MAEHTLDIAQFRAIFPAFANDVLFPNVRIQANWDLATAFIPAYDGVLLNGPGLQAALNFMTAHLLASSVLLAAGQTSVVVTGATIDKVSVSMAPPPTKSGWQWWLATTPYGVQLWALLSLRSAGGYYIGGMPERYGFRRVGGGFGPMGPRGFRR